MRHQHQPRLLRPEDPPSFADPRWADDEGLIAIGGDLSVARLVTAYDQGIFPWFGEGLPPLWWSPNPRAILDASDVHVSRSLTRTLRRHQFELRFNTAFDHVMQACAQRLEGSWIIPEMLAAYGELHRQGYAHSFEVWRGDRLVGGLYGVQRGALFAAESMFHRARDMSKVALVSAVRSLHRQGVKLFDVQFLTPHLSSLGARQISRDDYLKRLAQARKDVAPLKGLKPGCDP